MPLRILAFLLLERLRAVLQRKPWKPCGGFLPGIKQPGIRELRDAGGAHAKLSRGIRRRHGWDVRQLAGHGERDDHPAVLRLMA